MIDVKRIGRRIAEERKLVRRLSQEKMVEAMYDKLGVHWSQPDLSNLERAGTAIWDLSKLDKIADFFEIPLQNLLFGSGMEERMERYYGRHMEIRNLSGEKPAKEHVRLLNAATGDKTFDESGIPHYGWGPYTVYALFEPLQIGGSGDPCGPVRFDRFRLYAFFENGMVGVLRGTMAPVFALMNMAHLGRLQQAVPLPVLDVVDPAQHLNPWLPLMMFAPAPEERAVHEAGFFGRLEQLREHSGKPVFLVESVYVREDCRQKGMCRLMLDVLEHLFGEHV
ncbi:MAG: helix-turn-helix domain-containing protein, partial [Desulfovibrio sp.]|nr:helix-turn-helix domain-containing protein [Desulfovibrio sp.]